MGRNRVIGDAAEQLAYFRQGLVGVDVADDDQYGVSRRIPAAMERLQHLARGGVERGLRAERIVSVRGAGEHVLIQPVDEFVGGVG